MRFLGGEWVEFGIFEILREGWSVFSFGRDIGREGLGSYCGLEGFVFGIFR